MARDPWSRPWATASVTPPGLLCPPLPAGHSHTAARGLLLEMTQTTHTLGSFQLHLFSLTASARASQWPQACLIFLLHVFVWKALLPATYSSCCSGLCSKVTTSKKPSLTACHDSSRLPLLSYHPFCFSVCFPPSPRENWAWAGPCSLLLPAASLQVGPVPFHEGTNPLGTYASIATGHGWHLEVLSVSASSRVVL